MPRLVAKSAADTYTNCCDPSSGVVPITMPASVETGEPSCQSRNVGRPGEVTGSRGAMRDVDQASVGHPGETPCGAGVASAAIGICAVSFARCGSPTSPSPTAGIQRPAGARACSGPGPRRWGVRRRRHRWRHRLRLTRAPNAQRCYGRPGVRARWMSGIRAGTRCGTGPAGRLSGVRSATPCAVCQRRRVADRRDSR